jgi:hypothetical protein
VRRPSTAFASRDIAREAEVVVCRVDFGAGRNDVVDPVEDVVAQFHVRAGQKILEVLGCAGADEDRRDRGM